MFVAEVGLFPMFFPNVRSNLSNMPQDLKCRIMPFTVDEALGS